MSKRLATLSIATAGLAALPMSTVASASQVSGSAAGAPRAESAALPAKNSEAFDFEVTAPGKPKVTVRCRAASNNNIVAHYARHVLVGLGAKYGFRVNCTDGGVTSMATTAREKFNHHIVGRARTDICTSSKKCNPGVHSHATEVCEAGPRCAGLWRVNATWIITLKRGVRWGRIPGDCRRVPKNPQRVTCNSTSSGVRVPARH
ncbi:hypothetical protein [Actinomadura terrae]|uniref:hypothetical protein n=1 Tax=Actinomadura terrae TaxID=604353 RepID=UPI001FA6AA3C|nr:hypothetical protein [Actinomadura terrae]